MIKLLRCLPPLLAVLILSGWSARAAAWGDTGHRLVCEIALRNLTPAASAEVARLLQANATIRGANSRNLQYGWACTYPDHPADNAPPALARRSPLHFANYPRTLLAVTASSGCGVASQCVVTAIPGEIAVLGRAGASDADRAAAIVYLGHWLGDIHQPLHSSYEDDRGGNDINVSGLCTSNLHSAWDTCILQNRSQLGAGPSVDAVRALAATWSEAASDVDRALWLSSLPWQWSAESYAVTVRPEIGYCTIVEQACRYSATQLVLAQGQPKRSLPIDAAYMDRAFPIIRQRIVMGGIRLAHRLNLALDPAYRG
ncbi:MAG TPA: S1/P1 nuclease [Allosphingosinicella sp.]|jgi:hypothetical protein